MYRKILVPVDGSEMAERVLPHVQAILKIGGVEEVILLRAVEPLKVVSGSDLFLSEEQEKNIQESHEKDAEAYLHRLINRLQYEGVTLKTKVIVGKAAETIVDYATHNELDLIVMATHGRSGLSRWVMGSVAERILRWSCIPILIVRPPECIPKI